MLKAHIEKVCHIQLISKESMMVMEFGAVWEDFNLSEVTLRMSALINLRLVMARNM